MTTDRTRILALAADYDTAPTKAAKAVRQNALVKALHSATLAAGVGEWVAPSGKGIESKAAALRLWAVASRRTGKPGRPTTNRPHRLHVPATAATRDAIHAHAALTGRTRATVAGDVMEEWATHHAEAAALTAERDEARECAEIAAAAENANASELREARATLAELTQRLDPYVERNHDDGGTHAEALDSLIADAVRYSEVSATLDAVAVLVGGGDVVERVRELVARPVVWCGPWESVTGRRRLWFNNEAGDLDSLAASVGDAGWLVWTGKGSDGVQRSGPETGAKGERACVDALRSCGVEVRE